MNEARVSCIVPVHNGERFLAAALDSIRGQTHPVFETIVVDDGSTDDTGRIASGYESAVRVVRQENLGPAPARNRGIAEARGNYIAFLDADDYWDPEKTARQIECFARDPDLAYVASLVQNFWEAEVGDEAERMKDHRRAAPIPGYVTGAMLIRREWFDRVGPFDQALKHGDATEWIERATDAGASGHLLQDVLLYRRLHLHNYSRTKATRSRDEFLSLLKDRLDRRRQAEGGE